MHSLVSSTWCHTVNVHVDALWGYVNMDLELEVGIFIQMHFLVPGAPESLTPGVSRHGTTCGIFRAMPTGTWLSFGAAVHTAGQTLVCSSRVRTPPPQPPRPPHRCLCTSVTVFLRVVHCMPNPCGRPMAHRGTGSARRRREWRLRSMLRPSQRSWRRPCITAGMWGLNSTTPCGGLKTANSRTRPTSLAEPDTMV